MLNKGVFFAPHINLFGNGIIQELDFFIKKMGYHKALLVTDAGIVQLSIFEQVKAILEKADVRVSVYAEVQPNPTIRNVEEAFALFQAEKCEFIVTLGGGSPQDCGKAVAILAANGGRIQDYLIDKKPSDKSMDIVAISTTSGTGSECTMAYVISDEDTKSKYGVRDIHSQPIIAVNDSALMLELPLELTIGTGMDALTHALEAVIGKKSFLITKNLGLLAIKMIFDYLPKIVKDLQNQEYRTGMATAQYLAGLSFGNSSVGMVHSMSHQLSAMYHAPHGMTNAILLPYVLEYEKEDCVAELAEIADFVWKDETTKLTETEKAELTIQKVKDLGAELNVSTSIKSVGGCEADIDQLAEKALKDGSLASSAKVPNHTDLCVAFRRAMGEIK